MNAWVIAAMAIVSVAAYVVVGAFVGETVDRLDLGSEDLPGHAAVLWPIALVVGAALGCAMLGIWLARKVVRRRGGA